MPCLVMYGEHPGCIRVCGCCTPCSAVNRVVFSGHRISHRLSGHVLDQEPGREKQREVDDPKQ
jgi:hypothetical protein